MRFPDEPVPVLARAATIRGRPAPALPHPQRDGTARPKRHTFVPHRHSASVCFRFLMGTASLRPLSRGEVASAIARNCDLVQNPHLSPLPQYREREKTRLGVDAAFEVVARMPRDGSMIGTQPGLMTADGRKDGVERVAAGVTHDQAAMTVGQFDVAR